MLAMAVRNCTLAALHPTPQPKGKLTMNLTPQDLKVITMKGPKGHVPDGMKAATISGPNVLPPLPACPVLASGSFILWPMSYIDNRVSFGMVMYNPKWKAGAQVEKRGAR